MTTDATIRRDARDRAVNILVSTYEGEAFCHDLLDRMQAADALSESDAGLAAELTIGVSRHRLTCEHIAARFYRGRWLGLRVPVRVILSLGVYQLCWLDRVPDHAAVDQAVRQAKRHGRGTASTVNAILRQVAACRGEVIDRPDAPDARRYLPIDAVRGRLFDQNIFPDPARKPLDHIVAVTSHPPWLVERWHRLLKPALCRQVCDAGLRRPPLVLRPNATRINADALIERLAADGFSAAPGSDGEAVIVRDAPAAAGLSVISEGLCQPQDSTAGLALRLAPPQPGELVVDLCAGVGTKSTQAAELMNNTGVVIAADTNAERLGKISPAAERLGLTIIRPTPMDGLVDAITCAGRAPDLILADVPCLNTGVLARRPEARYRACQKALKSIVVLQRNILERAEQLAGPTARIIYATCSLEREENEAQIEAFCETFPHWRVERSTLTLPDADRDGGFAAVLVRCPPNGKPGGDRVGPGVEERGNAG